jgi:hypothetical protein
MNDVGTKLFIFQIFDINSLNKPSGFPLWRNIEILQLDCRQTVAAVWNYRADADWRDSYEQRTRGNRSDIADRLRMTEPGN